MNILFGVFFIIFLWVFNPFCWFIALKTYSNIIHHPANKNMTIKEYNFATWYSMKTGVYIGTGIYSFLLWTGIKKEDDSDWINVEVK